MVSQNCKLRQIKGPSITCDISTVRGRTTLQEGLSLCSCVAIHPMEGQLFHRVVWPLLSAARP
eukprot:2725009-Amphidinium_carterae.1